MNVQNFFARLRCHPKTGADNHGGAEGEAGYFKGTKGLPVGFHSPSPEYHAATRHELATGLNTEGLADESCRSEAEIPLVSDAACGAGRRRTS